MNADFESAAYARSHHELSRTVRAVVDTIRVSLAAIHRHDFAAPWKPRPRGRAA